MLWPVVGHDIRNSPMNISYYTSTAGNTEYRCPGTCSQGVFVVPETTLEGRAQFPSSPWKRARRRERSGSSLPLDPERDRALVNVLRPGAARRMCGAPGR